MKKMLMAGSLGVAISIVVVGLVLMTYWGIYWGIIFPGVRVWGRELGGMTVADAEIVLAEISRPETIDLVFDSYTKPVNLNDLGLNYDFTKTAELASQVGRQGVWWQAIATQIDAAKTGKDVQIQFDWNEEKINDLVAEIARDLDVPASEPQILVDRGLVSVNAGENGQVVEDQLLKERLGQAFLYPATQGVEIPVRELTPKLSQEQVNRIKSLAEALVTKKIVLTDGLEKWEIDGEELVTWVDPTSVETTAGKPTWKQQEIAQYITELAKSVDRPAQNASFRFENGRVEEFSPAIAGRVIKQAELAASLPVAVQTLVGDPAEITLAVPVTATEPAIKTEQVNNLGIRELIARGESRFTGSIPNRVFNIKKAANSMNGVLIAPGETFSFNKQVGDISAEAGYKQGYIIKDGQTILGDGGGVCQVSSTMFRAALAAGMPIEERWAHAYRVSYYEQDIGPGYDATIFTPSVDLQFKNDTPGYVLIQTKLDEPGYRLAFEFYGTNDGRKVSYSPTRVWDRTPPPPTVYRDDPTLPRGTTKLAEHAIWGSKVAFDWTVTRGEQVLQKRTWYSNFAPWQGVYLVGTR